METKLPTYNRKAGNWLETFTRWVEPRTDAPLNYIFWSGVFCIASALRRKVYISKKTLGAWDCYPYMYIMLVGPPAMRKTTAAKAGEDLMDEIPVMPSTPSFITQAALVDELMTSPDTSVKLLVEEFGDIILKGGNEMYEFLTSMYDGKKKLHQKTLKRGAELANAPCINMLAATTPTWIAENMPPFVIGGGLGSRVVWVYEAGLRDPRFFPRNNEIVGINFQEIQDKLVADLDHIANNIEGEVSISQEVKDWLEDWFVNELTPQTQKASDKLKSYYGRKHVQLLKLAMNIHFARKDTMELDIEDVQAALMFLNGIEKHLPKVFGGIGKNPYTLDIQAIIQFVNDRGKATRRDILKEFESVAPANVLDQLLQGCVAAGTLNLSFEGTGVDMKRIYTVKEEIEE